MRRALAALFFVSVVACGGGGDEGPADAPIDSTPPVDANLTPDADPETITRLIETGLCANDACTEFAEGVHEYTPRWALWSDTAAKRRWIWLPPGTTIDTSDMNNWKFPDGTKLWKEFARDGIRVETRLLTKRATDDWFGVAYVWNAEQNDAIANKLGLDNANGTEHDVPSKSECTQCHERTPNRDRVLGFSALHLDYDAPAGQLDLQAAIAAGMLSAPPTSSDNATAYFPLFPGAVGDRADKTRAVLGYLATNCGHCHNADSDVFAGGRAPFDVALDVTELGSFEATNAYTTLVGKTAAREVSTPPPATQPPTRTLLVAPGDPDHSVLMARFNRLSDAIKMPPKATEIVDAAMATEIQAWISSLPQ